MINHSAAASVTLDTDFGSLLTNEEFTDKTYRITNTGSRTLNIGSIQLSPGNVGFSILGAVPSSINAGQSATFTVRFAPVNQGLQTAEVVIAGNITPDNPFRFEVKGAGKSCNLTPVPIAQYGFEGAAPSNMAVTQFSGNVKIIGGTTNNTNPNPVGSRLYYANNDNHTNLYSSSSPTRSWYVRGTDTGTTTVEFGPVDLTNQQEVSINFDLAAFGLTNTNISGVNSSDYVILSVYNPTTSLWSDEIRLNGSNNAQRLKYGYGASGLVSGMYDGNGTVEATKTFTNSATTSYGSFKLDIPPSISQLRYRITAYTSRTWSGGWQNYNLWLIDNVHVDAGNAKFKTWNGTAWVGENANRPGPREKAVFAGDYNFTATGNTADLSVCECEVNNSAVLTIPNGKTLTVSNKIINHGNEDNFVVQTGGNLIQIEDEAVNSGSITAERYVTDMDNVLGTQLDYVYWSSPVTGQDLRAFSPGTRTNKIFYYNEPNDLFKAVNFATEPNFVPGKGYAFEAETTANGTHSPNATGYNETYKFKGTPNNGVIRPDVQRSANTGSGGTVEHGYNLIGNPYPSNMSFPQFYAMNSGIIYNTAWFWTNNSYIPNQQGSGYEQNNYAVWTGTGGAPATTTSAADGSGDTFIPDGIVAVGQGFIVQVRPEYIGTGPQQLIFKNKNGSNMVRVSTTGHFFNKEGDQKDRFWLKLISSDSIVNTQLIGYIEGATNDFEKDYDAEIMGMSSNIFYSTLEDRKLQIQGKAAFDPSDKVQLGANIFKNGTYTIAIENPEGIFNAGQKVYLKDNLLNRWVDLNVQAYTFEATKGITEGRFEIVYESPTVLATDAVTKDDLLVYRNGTSYVVKSAIKNITGIEVYDVSGRLWKKLNTNSKEVIIDASALNSGMYILKINRNGEISGRKIMK
ncbi:MAG: T9SS type A sorting domain-containing protein [Flavobacteriales bacterium]|nr:T9SS type A sorting domain-containing protein [Flavobacteriales bacterium]MCA0390702.1 T9SS type A sorting domain-containing protein [Bacteroidota bacterium]